MKKPSKELIEFIKKHEGFMPQEYTDIDRGAIGYGHNLKKGEKASDFDLNKDGKVDKQEAEALLIKDIEAHQKPWKSKLKVGISDEQEAALTSLAFNRGAHHKVLSEIIEKINSGDMQGAADLFTDTEQGSKYGYRDAVYEKGWAKGLDKRRREEQEMFSKGVEPEAPKPDNGVLDMEFEKPSKAEPNQSKMPEFDFGGLLGGTAQAAEREPPAEPKPGWHAPMSLDSELAEEDWGVMGPPEESEVEVRKGDTLSKIAQQRGLDWKELAKLNNLDNPDLIFPGQKIRLK